MNFIGISPVKALIYTAMLYGVSSPVLIGVILHISNNKKIMGEFTNGKLSNALGVITLILMTASAVALLYFELT
jgi:Mn2+/Fe2+ NRAMP family transporter